MLYRDPNPTDDPTRGEVEVPVVLAEHHGEAPEVIFIEPEPAPPATIDEFREAFRTGYRSCGGARVIQSSQVDHHGTAAEELARGNVVDGALAEASRSRRVLDPAETTPRIDAIRAGFAKERPGKTGTQSIHNGQRSGN